MSMMLTQMGMSMVGSFGAFASASIEADLQEKIRQYRNNISLLSAARSQNAVTVNEARVQDAAVRNDIEIQKQALRDQGQAKVDAAAAGVTGNSVKMTMRELKGSAAEASYAVKRQTNQQLTELQSQKTSIAIQGVLNKDVQVIPKPSVASMLLGAGTNLLNIYDSHQPEGSRLLGPNGGRVGDPNVL